MGRTRIFKTKTKVKSWLMNNKVKKEELCENRVLFVV